LRRAGQAIREPRNRKTVIGCGLAAAFLVVFGVYAVLAGPPPKSEAVVVFEATATAEQKEAVRQACPTVGNAVQLPPDTGELATSRVYPLRYDIAKASEQDLTALYRCIQAQPLVVGITKNTQGQ
jgi:hypothetical protein